MYIKFNLLYNRNKPFFFNCWSQYPCIMTNQPSHLLLFRIKASKTPKNTTTNPWFVCLPKRSCFHCQEKWVLGGWGHLRPQGWPKKKHTFTLSPILPWHRFLSISGGLFLSNIIDVTSPWQSNIRHSPAEKKNKQVVTLAKCHTGIKKNMMLAFKSHKSTQIQFGVLWFLSGFFQHCRMLMWCRVIENYMAQSLHFGLYGFSTNLPFSICSIYFYLRVYLIIFIGN